MSLLLQSLLETNAIATDLSGNVVWYGPYGISFITRPVTGGTFVGILEDGRAAEPRARAGGRRLRRLRRGRRAYAGRGGAPESNTWCTSPLTMRSW